MLDEGSLHRGQDERSVASADARDQTCSSQIQVAGIMRYTSSPFAVPTKQNLAICKDIGIGESWNWERDQRGQSQTNTCCPQVLVRQSFALCTLVSKGSPMKYSLAGYLLVFVREPGSKTKNTSESLDSDSRITEKEPCITRFRSTSSTAKTVSNHPTSAKPRTRGMFQALSSNVTGVVLPSVRVVPTDLCKCGAIV